MRSVAFALLAFFLPGCSGYQLVSVRSASASGIGVEVEGGVLTVDHVAPGTEVEIHTHGLLRGRIRGVVARRSGGLVYVVTSAPLYRGDSGSPVSRDGRLVGLVEGGVQ